MDRRSFLSWVGVGWIASCLPVAIVACSSDQSSSIPTQESPSSSSSGAAGNVQVGLVSDLDKSGQLLNGKTPIGQVLVARDPADPKALIAVNPKCTHAGCTVAWNSEQKAFVCPCHAAKFGSDGNVQSGPAARPLPTYQASIQGDSVVIKQS
ncbi:ubiquinol-cytochrome c reductase iron-sulfur subunit [Stenomitos frigidus]|uniref:Cytochrome B6 n=1 Tax=Stenomitos frigidus ULC18 TaxID=2107698 RepID=A0A2T1DUJ0_9CYAN|nr:ubiquinol-cytochrome c reductase iron-sulfur subunit [Stenomitos frigidus]PSB24157.1 cytochrome B6 [Stenomitos frigidus ULC18]